MSDHATSAHLGAGHATPDHVPHVTPLPIYLKTFATLMVLTIITVGVSYVDLGTSVNLAIAIVIATTKAVVVAAFFMHLATDNKFYTIALASAFVFLGIFVAFTMFDTEARGKYDKQRRERPANMADPFAVPSSSAAASAGPAAAAAPAPAAK